MSCKAKANQSLGSQGTPQSLHHAIPTQMGWINRLCAPKSTLFVPTFMLAP